MTTTDAGTLHRSGIDAAAIKPAECDPSAAAKLPVDTVTIDFEGREHVPDSEILGRLAAEIDTLRVTVPVRADGYDPLGDDTRYEEIPPEVKLVVVAGHPAYLSAAERSRSVRERLEAVVRTADDPWVGTEGVERAARATGATQFLLLSPSTGDELRTLRDDGIEGGLAVYAPTVLDEDSDAVLDAVGPYVRRRGRVRHALSDGVACDSRATGRTREVLLEAAREYALVGDAASVRERVAGLRDAGADRIVGYPAQGLDAFGVDE